MENNKLSEMMQSTMSSIKDLVEVNNIVGEPIVTPDGQTIIPVSKLSFGFGGAGGDSLGGSKQGYAKNGVDRIIDMMPDVMDKIESIANTNKKTD